MTTVQTPATRLRVDFDATASSQLDTLRRTLSWLEAMQALGWTVDVTGHLTAEIRRTPTAVSPPVVERKTA